ncbi:MULTISPECIES: ABC transporter permease [Nocardiopsis]|uniref:Binding-protein-dependent transport systems inner membrane component n=1 Tax=Nocardiopsis dassonvillei (strain ATCC 23218 / DSM 43111 / CIP 107115 / JCM 7437 / KCTC 9190 / NBRC 14626 / NCTC 10488 / NRRL B-5397 / IMRU 509) TaxID=446468 RepID=D7B533_NOCDD|nr:MULTISPECIES: ABC transporter permease [Nocardiopsis]ADH69054.1 binding-protein-dependent transport systems inner membrane component [Nocardiopsis dassonvillei subsp. dassonvillei DSM 43111]APC37095.1 peptide ABC transporter permease [Nocardiopsis dassonvillei]NKY78402.1 ABC transporter permease [Nocardiopsis dassonvillei]VEI89564.1 Probable D,D-dipeptide transport system permease protein ddpC [Nocardiopsis dassonvillei]
MTNVAGAPGTAEKADAPEPAGRKGSEALYFARRNPKLLIGSGIVLAFLLLGIVGPFFVSDSPNEYVGPQMQAPNGEYWLGTTTFGQDIWAQFVHGVRATFIIGLFGGGVAFVIGTAVGFVAGYKGGIVDEILNMITNVVLVLPAMVVLIVAIAYLDARGLFVQGLFIGLTAWPWAARAVRSQALSLATRDYVDLARLSGRRTWKIITTEIAPNMSSYLVMAFILQFGGAVLTAAGLDFIGLGPSNGVSLGLMLESAVAWSALTLGMWWWFIPPGLGITVIVGSLYILNVGLDEVFNPKLREL